MAAVGQQPTEIGADEEAGEVGHDEADPADDARGGHARGRDEGRGRDDDGAQEAGRKPEGASLLLGQREDVHAPAQRQEDDRAERDGAEQGHEVAGVGRGEAAEQPEGHGRELVVGIGEDFTRPTPEPSSAPITTPASTRTRIGSCVRREAPTA